MVAASKKRKIFDGRFEIVGIVGRGSQSVVYHAQNATNPDSHVALKVLVNHGKTTSNQQLNERLRKEALAMVAARHRYVIRIEDFHSLESICYLSMEYAPEGDLRKYVSSRDNRLPTLQAERLFMQIVEALCAAHKSGIIHRDVKPENILVIDDQEVRLGDFGTAALPGDEASIEELKKGVGTFAYMAPEVLEGIEYTESCDLYSLGVTFYELLVGKHPFEGVPMMKQLTIRQNQNIPPINKIVPNISAKFATAITKCMSYNKADRPKSAEELLEFMISGQVPKQSLSQKVDSIKEVKPTIIPPPPPLPQNTSRGQIIEPTLGATTKAALKAGAEVISNPDTRKTTVTQEMRSFDQFVEPSPSKPKPPIQVNQMPLTAMPTQTIKPAADKIEALREEPAPSSKSLARDLIAAKNNGTKKSAPNKSTPPSENKSSFRVPWMGLVILVLVGLVFWKFKSSPSTLETSEERAAMSSSMIDAESPIPSSDEPLIPAAGQETGAFPLLAAGMYHGEIQGLYPNTSHSLTIISFPDAQKIAFIVGIEGWIPAVVSTEELKSGDTISVAANGFILKVSGQQLEEGEIVGFFKNASNDQQGDWRVKKLTRAGEE
jgi:serine/threonine-protein kinase